jgi:predicted TIM-barrel fold metal-dependent hydrolase
VPDPKSAIELARDVNDYAAAFVKAHPDRLSTFAAVPLQDRSAAAIELESAVVGLGVNHMSTLFWFRRRKELGDDNDESRSDS